MSDLIEESPDAVIWVEKLFGSIPEAANFGRLVSSVIWTDEYLRDGEPLGGNDPSRFIAEINKNGFPLLRGHDPGLPVGRIIAAREFTSPSGIRFVATISTFYEPTKQLKFADVGVDPTPSVVSPPELKPLMNAWIDFGIDPREVDSQWVEKVLDGAPIRVERVELSHNAADASKELIRIGLPFALFIWNPFVTTIANEAAKEVYAGLRRWLQKLWKSLKERKDPIVALQSQYAGCEICYLFRGRDVDQLYAAHEALHIAGAQAYQLIRSFEGRQLKLASLVYEFEKSRWFPSYAILGDGRIISDRNILIAFEQLPRGLSMGLRKRQNRDE